MSYPEYLTYVLIKNFELSRGDLGTKTKKSDHELPMSIGIHYLPNTSWTSFKTFHFSHFMFHVSHLYMRG